MTCSAARTMRRSTPWMCFCGCFFTQPWWRPCSVACTVTSHGQPKRRASLRAAPATSQSWEWTRSKESESPRAAPAARMSSFMASTQRTKASRSSFGNSGSRTRWTVTPWRSSTSARRPPPRARTCTSTPLRTSPSASLRTWRASPPSTIGGYSHDRMRTRMDTAGGGGTPPKPSFLPHPESPFPSRPAGAPPAPCPHPLESPFLGAAAEPLRAADLAHHDLLAGDPLPDLGEVDGLISFGGAQSVTEIDRYPYLLAEAELLREAIARDVPVLGVCLGAQLLAHALGGSVRRLPRRAVRWVELARVAADDLVPERVWALHWNEDAIEPPPGATELLERGGLGCAAFRIGSGLGIQFHADVDGPTLDGWYARYGDWVTAAGVELAAAQAADAEHLPGQPATAEAIFGGFVRRARAARTRAPT